MRSNYKPIGNYIQLVDERNKGLKVTNLVGLSISKQFIKSVANTIGTDMENYKIIRKNQFACSTMQVRRDKKMPLALYNDSEPAIISQAYPVFEINDTTKLLPEYLMMWFTRSEFDREACFHAVGGVRGSLEWEDFCGMQLPIPSLEKQQEIVREYNTIQNRIALNNQLISKLEETAQAIYKQWFVDFEYPDMNGLPYRSNGGKMVWCTELEKEIPTGWTDITLGEISTCLDFKRRPLSQEERELRKGVYPYYGAMSIVDYVDDYLYDGDYLLFSEDGANIIDENGYPAIQFVWGKFWLNNHSHILDGKGFISIQFLFNSLLKTNVSDIVTGAAQPKINQQNMNGIRLLIGNEIIHVAFNRTIAPFYKLLKNCKEQNQKLGELKELLLARMTKVEAKVENI